MQVSYASYIIVKHNCDLVSPDLEKDYTKLLRRTLNVRNNTPALTLYIEPGFLPVNALIQARQFKFFKRYRSRALANNTPRCVLFAKLHVRNNLNHDVRLNIISSTLYFEFS